MQIRARQTVLALLAIANLFDVGCAKRLDTLIENPAMSTEEIHKRCEHHVPQAAQSECFKRLADRLFEHNDFQTALEFYERSAAPAIAARVRHSRYRIALQNASHGNYGTAQQQLEKAGYDTNESQVELGDVAYERGNFDDAARLYRAGQLPTTALRLRMSQYMSAFASIESGDLAKADGQLQLAGYTAEEIGLIIAHHLLTKGTHPEHFTSAVDYFERSGFSRPQALTLVANRMLPEAVAAGNVANERLAASFLVEAGADPNQERRRLHLIQAEDSYRRAAASDTACQPRLLEWKREPCFNVTNRCESFQFYDQRRQPTLGSSRCDVSTDTHRADVLVSCVGETEALLRRAAEHFTAAERATDAQATRAKADERSQFRAEVRADPCRQGKRREAR